MTEENKSVQLDNKQDEIIDVRLPRKDYETLREVIERENAYTWFKTTIRSWWVWAIAGGLISIFTLSDVIKGVFK